MEFLFLFENKMDVLKQMNIEFKYMQSTNTVYHLSGKVKGKCVSSCSRTGWLPIVAIIIMHYVIFHYNDRSAVI